MRRRMMVLIGVSAALGLIGGMIGGSALATPSSGVTAETARGPLVDRPLAVNWRFEPGNRVKLQTRGPIELAYQRIVAAPGATFGWHTHPGPTLVTILRGTMSFYHAEDCTEEIQYGPGTSFSNLPDEVHLARNEGTEELVVYAVYFVPVNSPPLPLRIDQPSPGPGCPL
jgi:quercetin dioxygenase-like cupin family protein